MISMIRVLLTVVIMVTAVFSASKETSAQAVIVSTATTTINLSICGNELVDVGEDCDVLGETGLYSTTIAGRQCTPICRFGPYCGDTILQTQYGEECDDGNNDDGDFCSASCTIEPAGGGGGSSGGGSGGSGGSSRDLGDTVISVSGLAYPSQTVNFLLDTKNVGTVRANSSGRFEFSIDASPGTATLGIWALDSERRRSITLNNTFDVTQGAVTNVRGLILPPTISVPNPNINPGAPLLISGQTIPNAQVEVHFDDSEIVAEATAGSNGAYSLTFNTGQLRVAEHSIKARSITGTAPLLTESSFSSSLKLFVGVDGQASTPSDLNRSGRVDLTDFSILIFWWQSPGGDSDPPADINGNGNVGLEDFSILLFNWTG